MQSAGAPKGSDTAADASSVLTDHAAVARWFLRRGVPSMLDGTAIGRDVGRRMAPMLVMLYFVMLGPYTLNGPWSLAGDALFALVTVVATWVISNIARGRRPFSRKVQLGWAEYAVFVLVPPLMYAIMQHIQVTAAAHELGEPNETEWVELGLTFGVGVVIQLVVLFLLWALVYVGVVSLVTYLTREIAGSLGDAGVALARTVPLLLGVVTFFFFTAEVWQTVGRITTVAYTATILLFVGVSGFFLASRWQVDLGPLSRFADRDELTRVLDRAATPHLSAPQGGYPRECPIGPAQERNLRLVIALAKLVVATLVGSCVYVFFLVMGILSVTLDTVKNWAQADPKLLLQFGVASHTFALTWEHLKVAGFLAVFTGFYFSIVSATDAKLREGLRDTAEDAVREACAARVALLDHNDAGPKGSEAVELGASSGGAGQQADPDSAPASPLQHPEGH